MAIQFTTTRQEGQGNGIKVLVYGGSGIGKTTLCATAPAPLIISAESGLLALRHYDIPVMKIATVQDLYDAYNMLITQPEQFAQFQTICIDSISELAEILLKTAKQTLKHALQAYGEMLESMIDLTRKFRDLPNKNVVVVAKQEYFVDQSNGVGMYQPFLPGSKLGPSLPYYFDEVFSAQIGTNQEGEEVRFLQTHPSLKVVAKDRSGALDQFETPNLTDIFNKILIGENK